MNTYIIVRLQYEATHRWADCPLEAVSFLQHEHRHVFHIVAKKIVQHVDRDIEIIMFKQSIEKYLEVKYGRPGRLEGLSCEELAWILVTKFDLASCEVSEDGENGAVIEA